MNPTLIWPLTLLLIFFVLLRQAKEEVAPIFKSIAGGLTQDAARNAKQYAIALGFGLTASLSAFADVFKEIDAAAFGTLGWHQYATLWAKVVNPFVAAVLAYAVQVQNKLSSNGGTNPPMPRL